MDKATFDRVKALLKKLEASTAETNRMIQQINTRFKEIENSHLLPENITKKD